MQIAEWNYLLNDLKYRGYHFQMRPKVKRVYRRKADHFGQNTFEYFCDMGISKTEFLNKVGEIKWVEK